jgi:hypothetical protein
MILLLLVVSNSVDEVMVASLLLDRIFVGTVSHIERRHGPDEMGARREFCHSGD